MRGSLGDFVSHGGLKNPVIFRSHGNRARSIEEGEIKVDVAFLGVPVSDPAGNANGQDGDAVFGSLGYALMDARYANKVVLLTDNIVDYQIRLRQFSKIKWIMWLKLIKSEIQTRLVLVPLALPRILRNSRLLNG